MCVSSEDKILIRKLYLRISEYLWKENQSRPQLQYPTIPIEVPEVSIAHYVL